MIILYILGGIIAIFLMYILFLFVCSLFVRTDRQYMETAGSTGICCMVPPDLPCGF